MIYSILQIIGALNGLDALGEERSMAVVKLNEARELMVDALLEMDEISVKGRKPLDTLLGCMMAIESIIGEDDNHG